MKSLLRLLFGAFLVVFAAGSLLAQSTDTTPYSFTPLAGPTPTTTTFRTGSTDGTGSIARFSNPQGVAAAPAGKPQQLTSLDQVPEGLAKSDWQSIRAAYEAGRHAFRPTESGWQARNPGQQWATKFDGRGFVAEPRDGGWQWGLELKSYGFGPSQQAVGGTPAVKADGQRLTYQWDATVQEWFINDQRGLEHGFTVSRRPAPPLGTRRPAA